MSVKSTSTFCVVFKTISRDRIKIQYSIIVFLYILYNLEKFESFFIVYIFRLYEKETQEDTSPKIKDQYGLYVESQVSHAPHSHLPPFRLSSHIMLYTTWAKVYIFYYGRISSLLGIFFNVNLSHFFFVDYILFKVHFISLQMYFIKTFFCYKVIIVLYILCIIYNF